MARNNGKITHGDTITHLLVIRLSAMGDVAISAPIIYTLATNHPTLRITILTKRFYGPIFSAIPNASVYYADVKGKHKGMIGLWKLYKELRALRIDAVADLHNVLRSNILKFFFKSDGIPFPQISKGRDNKKALTAKNNKVFKQLKTTSQRYIDVFSSLGFSLNLNNTLLFPKQLLSDHTLKIIGSNAQKWVGVAPFAAFEGKRYPLHLMEDVLQALDNTKKYKILLFGGGKEEREQLNSLEEKFECGINMTGKLTFQEELALISNLDLMLSMDSGNAHLAAMYGIPVVTLWGVTHPYAGFYPIKQARDNALLANRDKYPLIPTSVYGNKMPSGYEKAMETISPEAVFQKIEMVLRKGNSASIP
ncbi:MAG: glycosyltransferase family 9 protein [Bacteroidota bacterium]